MLNPRRSAVVERAFAAIDVDGNGTVPMTAVLRRYNGSRHPRVLEGTLSEAVATQLMLEHISGGEVNQTHLSFGEAAKTGSLRAGEATLDSAVSGLPVTLGQFMQYHAKVGGEVDRLRVTDKERLFESMITALWDLDVSEEENLVPTGIIPVTLNAPTGLAATNNMDLVWPDPAQPDNLVGFRGAVKPLFGRNEIPMAMRGHFAFPKETQRRFVRWLPLKANGSLQPLCLVWQDEEGGPWFGLRAALVNSVDVTLLPPELAAHIVRGDEANRRGAAMRDLAPAQNPVYMKSSQAFGAGGYQHQAQQIATMKKNAYENTGVGQAWQGRVGKFTDTFKGGPWKNDGLNM